MYAYSCSLLLEFRIILLISIGLVFGLLMVAAATAVSLSQYLTADDQVQLRQLFDSPTSYKDAVSSYWSLKGLSVLKALPKDTTVCYLFSLDTCLLLHSGYDYIIVLLRLVGNLMSSHLSL